MRLSSQEFPATVPKEFIPKTFFFFHQSSFTSDPEGAPFLPSINTSVVNKDDYVLLTLDVESGEVEKWRKVL